jgi:DNA gyrase/topoisomerase IV subunit B
MKQNFKVLSDIEHVLHRPSMYIGSVDLTERTSYLYKDDKFEYASYTFVPGLIKIIDEIIDNAVDVAIRTKFRCNKIRVRVTENEITVQDNGSGIPVEKLNGTDQYLPELAWSQMRAGTSFEDDRETIGANGLGSVACNIFSTRFTGISDDGQRRFTLKCKNNLSDISHDITDSKEPGVTVKFKPDLEKFGLDKIDEIHMMLVHQRLINLAVTFPQIDFVFNNRKININPRKFIRMFSDGKEVSVETDNCIIGVLPNEYDDFKFYTYVNGISMPNGGNHVEYVTRQIVDGVRAKLVKKHKSIKPGDIRNKMQLVLFMKNFPNPKFDSQTKERLTNSQPEIGQWLDIDFDKIIQQVLRNKDIIDPMVEMFKMKEELRARRELKNTTKKKKIVSDKYIPPTKDSEILFLCEGLSAMGGISAILGRENFGYYAMKGVPLNAYDCTAQKLSGNKEIKEIVNILDMDLVGEDHDISYQKVGFATDADADGAHISGLLLGLFYRYGKNLFTEKRVYRLKTPIMVAMKKGKIIAHFFTIDEYREWEKTVNLKGVDFKYSKGLGSWKKEELQQLINEHGIDAFLEYFSLDDIDVIDRWLKSSRADDRKEELSKYALDLNKV